MATVDAGDQEEEGDENEGSGAKGPIHVDYLLCGDHDYHCGLLQNTHEHQDKLERDLMLNFPLLEVQTTYINTVKLTKEELDCAMFSQVSTYVACLPEVETVLLRDTNVDVIVAPGAEASHCVVYN